MRFALLASLLFAACAHRPAVVHSESRGAAAPLLGTWRGAMDTNPVTLRVFGSDDDGLHAEMEVIHNGAVEQWVLVARPDDSEMLTFAAADGMPLCSAAIDRNRLTGTCEVEPGGRKRQWLVVRL